MRNANIVFVGNGRGRPSVYRYSEKSPSVSFISYIIIGKIRFGLVISSSFMEDDVCSIIQSICTM